MQAAAAGRVMGLAAHRLGMHAAACAGRARSMGTVVTAAGLLRRAGKREQAMASYGRATELAANDVHRADLRRRQDVMSRET